jgi:hypothetical protein
MFLSLYFSKVGKWSDTIQWFNALVAKDELLSRLDADAAAGIHTQCSPLGHGFVPAHIRAKLYSNGGKGVGAQYLSRGVRVLAPGKGRDYTAGGGLG